MPISFCARNCWATLDVQCRPERERERERERKRERASERERMSE
jgi:hypothetical protein